MLRFRAAFYVICLAFLSLGLWSGCPAPVPPLPEGTQGDASVVVDRAPPPPGCTANADCSDPSKPLCVKGVCKAECSLDVHCRDASKPKCSNGVCGPECSADGDCTDATKPRCDGGRCVAPPPSGCKSDDDCKNDPAGPKCDVATGKCGPATPTGCKSDDDCKSDPAGPTCDVATGKCGPKPECLSDADCTDPTKPTCSGGKCVSTPPECNADGDCQDPSRPKCKSGKCEPECAADGDCTDASKPKCKNGKCDAECAVDGDCTDPTKPKCKSGSCQPECAADADCTDANKPLCTKGVCTPKTGCKADGDCKDPKLPKCELSSGDCKACVVDNHCQSYQSCVSYSCELKPGACVAKTDCKDANKPHCVKNACVECQVKADCKPLFSCVGGACTSTGCQSDAECAAQTGKYCDTASRKCVACTLNSHCASGQFCDTGSFTCKAVPGCTSDSDCKAPLAKCNTTTKKCVACLQASDCAKDANSSVQVKCVNNVCYGCQVSKDCNLAYICPSGGGYCAEGCTTNRDCPTSKPTCSSSLKKCVACEKSSDCPSGEVCDTTSYTCQYRCSLLNRYDVNCARRYPNPRRAYCDGNTRTCEACIPVAFGSTSTIHQGCNTLAPVCKVSTRTCVECAADKDCRPGSGATAARCDASKNTCYECTQNSDCRRGFICDAQTRKCRTGCAQDSDCSGGRFCEGGSCLACSASKPNTCPSGQKCDTRTNSCVLCLTNADCKSGETCIANKCYGATGRDQCLPCTQNSDCATGLECKSTTIFYASTSNTFKVNVCLQKYSASKPCAAGYANCVRADTQRCHQDRIGYCWPNYGYAGAQGEGYGSYRSCAAVISQGQPCTLSSNGRTTSCGHKDRIKINNFAYGDSICDRDAKVCRIGCSPRAGANNCTAGYSCKCPAGSSFNSSGYCYANNRFVGYGRCVK